MKSVKDIIDNHSRVCWYPSAGDDFRVLMFLSKQYCEWKHVDIDANSLPTLFILTDCYPKETPYVMSKGESEIEKLNSTKFNEIKTLYRSIDRRTVITVSQRWYLQGLDIPFNDNLFSLGCSYNYGKAFYWKVHIKSKQLGEWDTEVIYILTENTGFAFEYLIPQNISIDYIVRVRYGEFFGGSTVSGQWLLKLIKPLNVKYFLSNYLNERSFMYVPEQLEECYSNWSEIWKNTDAIQLNEVYCVEEKTWSNQGDIHWYRMVVN